MADKGIIARLRADVSDYVSKMAVAREAFNKRMAVIRAGHAEELRLARAALREKETLAAQGAKIDIEAARRTFQERVKFASAATAAEIKEAKRTMTARTQANGSAAETSSRFAMLASQFTLAGAASQKSNGGIGRLNDALITMTRTATGVPPVVGKLTDVLGSFMIGVGPMVPILAGITGIAVGFAKITEASREARKATADLLERLQALAKSQQDPIVQMSEDALAAAVQVEKAAKKLAAVSTPKTITTEDNRGNRSTRTIMPNVKDMQEAHAHLDTWRAAYQAALAGIGDIAEASFQKIKPLAATTSGFADEAERAAKAWQRVREEVDKTAYKITVPDIAGRAQDQWFRVEDREKKARGWDQPMPVPAGPVATAPGGLFGAAMGSIKGMLKPKDILNNALGGLASGGISFAIGAVTNHAGEALGKLSESIFGMSEASKEAAAQMRMSINSIRAEIAAWSGDETAARFFRMQSDFIDRLKSAGLYSPDAGLEKATTAEELKAAFEAWVKRMLANPREVIAGGFADAFKNVPDLMKWLEGAIENLGKTITTVNDALRNMPAGWKVNLAAFNATSVGPTGAPSGPIGSPGDRRYGNVTFVIENVNASSPEDFLSKVEIAAVRKIRSGGRLRWELGRGAP